MRKIKELNSHIEAGKGLAQEIAQKDKVCTTYLPQKKAEPALHACGLSQILKGIAQAFFNAFLIDGGGVGHQVLGWSLPVRLSFEAKKLEFFLRELEFFSMKLQF